MESSGLLDITVENGGTSQAVVEGANQIYASLPDNYIRVVRILPTGPDEDISCAIETILLDQARYTALSYAWGAPPASRSIRINGVRCSVRQNLWRFLYQARLASDGQVLYWIDALCINQADSQERMHQVGQMAQIYSKAHEVLTWLGPAYGDSNMAMSALDRQTSYWHNPKHYNSVWKSRAAYAIHGICARPYWSRLWVFQELMRARRVVIQCGGLRLPLERVRAFLAQVNRTGPKLRFESCIEYASIKASAASAIIQQTLEPSGNFSLWNLLFATRRLQCSERRDKIYALLGVASSGHEEVSPDYDLPIVNLLNLVLRKHHEQEKPISVADVEQQCKQLALLFDVDYASLFELNAYTDYPPLPPYHEMQSLPLKHQNTALSLWWTSFYNHYAVKELLVKTDSIDPSLLFTAIRRGCHSAVQLLLDTGKMDASFDLHWWTPLHIAAATGDAAILELLLGSAGFRERCNARLNPECKTALYLGVAANHQCIVELLLRQTDTDVNLACDNGLTPLHLASRNGNTRLVKLLLLRSADVNAQDLQSSTPLHTAIRHYHYHTVRELLRHDSVNVNAKTVTHQTPLDIASNLGYSNITEQLLDRDDIDVNSLTADLETPLHNAARQGDETIVRQLLQHNAAVDCQNRTGRTPLYYAVEQGSEAIVELLLRQQPSFADSHTLLHVAARHRRETIARRLMEYVDGTDVDEHGRTALDVAVEHGHGAIVEALLAGPRDAILTNLNCASETPLQIAAKLGHVEVTQYLLGFEGIDVNACSLGSDSAARIAIRHGHADVFRLLLMTGRLRLGDVSATDGSTILHLAAERGQTRIVRMILQLPVPASMLAPDSSGWTPLHLAAGNNHIDVMSQILKSGLIDVNTRGGYGGRTALNRAARAGQMDVARRLLAADGIDVHQKSKDGWSPYEDAQVCGHAKMTELFNEFVKTHPPPESLTSKIVRSLSVRKR